MIKENLTGKGKTKITHTQNIYIKKINRNKCQEKDETRKKIIMKGKTKITHTKYIYKKEIGTSVKRKTKKKK